jgi:N-acetylmuramoyl-L-alanine amidase
MAIKTQLNYSPSFNSSKRLKKEIKFIIFHYTGMKKESEAINRLTNIQSKVSCHYLVKKNGEILTLVPDLYTAWHAGKSEWKNFRSLNKHSIGIEISNPGHQFDYKKFSNKQIRSLLKLSKFLIKKYAINTKNILGHSDIAPERKKDPGEKFPWKYFAKNNIGLWHSLESNILKKNRRLKISKVNENYLLKNIFKIGYSKKISTKLDKKKYLSLILKAYQRRFRPELINGKGDRECLLISKNLVKKFN